MSLIYCHGCGHQIHLTATACPHCGAPQKTQNLVVANKNPTSVGQLLFSFDGRIARSTYWLKFWLPLYAIYAVAFMIDFSGVLDGAIMLFSAYSVIAVTAKRCHDVNRTGWFMLLQLIPILQIWPFIELGFMRGTIGDNQYWVNTFK